MVQELPQKATSDHKHLTAAYVSGALATIVIRYVASVGHPSIVHAVLALLALAGFVAAYLLIARSSAEPGVKAGTVVGAAVVSGVCFALVSYLFP
jgi:Flp pilus assembly protein TadB